MKKLISFVLSALLCVSSFLFTTADAFANTVANDVTSDISVQSSVPPSFAAPMNFEVDDRPRSLVSGDFNGDGRLDLANANNWSSNVSVLLGNGDGTFGPATNLAVARGPITVIAADVNNDGKLDLATGNWNPENEDVSVLLGNGDGTFGPATNFAIGTIPSPRGLVSGDFNSDGKLDLATANTLSNDVSVLLGDGNGTFVPTTNFAVAPGPSWSVVSGDFNSDDRLDLATANSDSNNVSVLLGNGDGTFQPADNIEVGTGPTTVIAADVNSDSKLDLATANVYSNNVSVLLGNGNGTFQPADNIEVYSAAYSVVAADVNGDGRLDLATAKSARYPNNISVVLGNDDGTFESPTNFPDGTNSVSIVSGDFNSDSRLDLATANWSSDTVSVLINTGTFNVSK